MGNSVAHQEKSSVLNNEKAASNSKINSYHEFEQKSSFIISNSLLSFRVNSSTPVVNSKKASYPQSKTVWPLPIHEIPFFPEFPIRSATNENSFNVISVVSSGAYGRVMRVTHKDDAKMYAMKVMSKSMIFKENLVQQVKTEAQIQVMCDHHPFLVRGPFRWQNKRNLFIVTDFIDGGDLHKLWQETGSFDEDLVKIYVAEVALVLDFLHNAGIIYRDLKMENILIDSSGHLKLIDFGLSKWLSFGDRCRTLCGTQQYMAPEILRLEPYTHSVDWWSLGILLYALLQGKFPFRNVSQTQDVDPLIEFHNSSNQPYTSPSESARRLVNGLLTVDPTKRLRSLRTLKNHAFYHHFDLESLGSKKVDPLPLLHKQQEKRREVLHESASSNTIDFD